MCKILIRMTLASILAAGIPAQAASIFAGKYKAGSCAQCHGIRTPAAEAPFPGLAGMDAGYLVQALKEYRARVRVSPIMNAMTGSLSDRDIADLAAYYSSVKP